MNKEVKITPPEGYEIDKENSTFDCIKFKKISKTSKRWRDNQDATTDGYWINSPGSIIFTKDLHANTNSGWSFAEEKQAKSARAMAFISQIMANDDRFGGVITDEEWDNNQIVKHGICREGNKIQKYSLCECYEFLAFHTRKQRDLFLEENEDLVKDYLMLD